MKLLLSAARASCFVWMLWFLGTWLLLEAGLLFSIIWLSNIPSYQLVGPYIALAVAPAAAGPLIYRVNRRRTDPPKRRAREMGIAAMVLIELTVTALSYSSVKLGLLSVSFAVTNTAFLWLFSGPIVYFGAYRAALAKAARLPRDADGQD
jgi:hypothetical protein